MSPPAAAPAGSGLRSVPGAAGLPVLGSTLRFLYDPLGWCRQRYDRYGPVSWVSLFGVKGVLLLGPDATAVAMQNRDKALGNGPGWEYFIGPFFRRGIMLLDFEEHLHHRHLMQQAFTRDRLSEYLSGMTPAIERGLAEWPAGDGFAVYPAIKQLTLDLATDTFMGGRLGPETDQINRAFIDCVRGAASLVRFPVPGLRWSRALSGRRVLERMLTAQLAAKRARPGDDLFSALCQAVTEDGQRFTDDDVVNHMIFLLMAAHDTSTITMTTMSYYLAKHPQWQQRCRDESRALGKPAVEFDDLDQLPSLDLVMKEALRLVTPLAQMPRRAVRDTEVLGHHIPKGSFVFVAPDFVHHMPELWPEPERFDPERFAEHRREDKVHRHAWIPFGAGVHKCIGMHFAGVQVKAVMHQLLLRYSWTVEPGYELPLDRTSLPTPKDGLPVRLRQIRS